MNGADPRLYTSKQMGDACEMLVAAEMTLAGMPALKVPDNWPHYDVIAQPPGCRLQRISVKSRTFKIGAAYVSFDAEDEFDWLAIVLLGCPGDKIRQIFIIPHTVAESMSNKGKKGLGYCEFRITSVAKKFSAFEKNFLLRANGAAVPVLPNTTDHND